MNGAIRFGVIVNQKKVLDRIFLLSPGNSQTNFAKIPTNFAKTTHRSGFLLC